jgi:hypothetical protein
MSRALRFWSAIAPSFLAVAAIAARAEWLLQTGVEVRLEVRPYDPMDALSGRYLAVPLAIQRLGAEVPRDLDPYRLGETVWVRLAAGDPCWRPVGVGAVPAVGDEIAVRGACSARPPISSGSTTSWNGSTSPNKEPTTTPRKHLLSLWCASRATAGPRWPTAGRQRTYAPGTRGGADRTAREPPHPRARQPDRRRRPPGCWRRASARHCRITACMPRCSSAAAPATSARAHAGEEPWDALVAVGGDGTVNEVLSGMPDPARPLAMLPVGTANVLASVRLPRAPAALAALIARGRTRLHALGVANGRRFLLFCGAGVDGAVVERLHASAPARSASASGPDRSCTSSGTGRDSRCAPGSAMAPASRTSVRCWSLGCAITAASCR